MRGISSFLIRLGMNNFSAQIIVHAGYFVKNKSIFTRFCVMKCLECFNSCFRQSIHLIVVLFLNLIDILILFWIDLFVNICCLFVPSFTLLNLSFFFLLVQEHIDLTLNSITCKMITFFYSLFYAVRTEEIDDETGLAHLVSLSTFLNTQTILAMLRTTLPIKLISSYLFICILFLQIALSKVLYHYLTNLLLSQRRREPIIYMMWLVQDD